MAGIGIRLQLQADFAKASSQAVADLGKIEASLDAVKEAGKSFNAGSIDDLVGSLSGLKTAAIGAKSEVGGLAGSVKSLGANSATAHKSIGDLIGSLGGLVSEGGKVNENLSGISKNLGDIGTKARTSGRRVKEAMDEAKTSAAQAEDVIIRLTSSITNIGQKAVVVDRLGQAFVGAARDAMLARDAVNEVEMAMLRLPTRKVVTIAIETTGNGPGTRALPGGGRSYYPSNVTSSSYSGSRYPNAQRMLPPPPPGGGITTYDAYPLEPSGGQQTWATGGGGGAPPPRTPWYYGMMPGDEPPQWGKNTVGAGRRMMGAGDKMQSAGMAGVVNGVMIGSVFVPIASTAMNNKDLEAFTDEALAHKGASQSSSNAFTDAAETASANSGGDFTGNVSGMQNFVAAIPMAKPGDKNGTNFNDPKQRAAIVDMYRKIVQLTVADSSSMNPLNTGAVAQDIITGATNLGFDTHTTAGLSKAVEFVTNFMAQLKNKSSSSSAQTAQALRALGPSMANVDPAMIATEFYVGSLSGLRGSAVGQQVKRLNTRQAMDPKPLAALQRMVSGISGGKETFDAYDKNGKAKDPLAVAAEVAAFEHQYKLSDKDRAKVNATVAGGWPIGMMAALTQFAFQNSPKGKENDPKAILAGMQNYGKKLIKDPPAGSRPGESPRDTTYRIRTEDNPEKQLQMTKGKFDKEALEDFKLMTPEIIKLLHSVNDLIDAWARLDPNIKKTVLTGGAILLTFTAVGGILGVLVGNFVKLGGALLTVGGFIVQGVEKGGLLLKALSGIGSVLPRLGTLFTTLGTLGASAIRLIGLAFAANPIGVIVTGLIIAGGLLYTAWTHDFLGIREIVAGAIKGFHSEFDGAGTWLLASGKAFVDMFVKGFTGSIDGAKNAIKGGLQKIRDLFPHSPPPDGSSPLAGQEASGQAYIDQLVGGMIDRLGQAPAKLKKALKPVSDVFIYLKNETVAQVESTAKAMEASLSKHGAIIKKKWLDIISPGGGVTRVQGNDSIYRDAARLDSQSLGRTYTGDAIAKRQQAEMTAMFKPAIDAMKAAAALAERFHVMIGDGTSGISGRFAQENKQGDEFSRVQGNYSQRLSNAQRMQGKSDDPTKSELNQQMQIEMAERQKLLTILANEESEYTAIKIKMDELKASNAALNDVTDVGGKQRAANAEAIGQLNTEYDNLGVRLQTQHTDITVLGRDIDNYVVKINNAKVALTGFALVVSNAFDAAAKSSDKVISSGVGKRIDELVGNALGGNSGNKNRNNIFATAATDFVGTFIKTLVSKSLDDMFTESQSNIAGFFNKLLGGGSSTTLGQIANSTGKGKDRVTDPLTAGGVKTPSGTLSDPVATTLVGQTGSADIGSDIDDNTSEQNKTVQAASTAPTISGGGTNFDSYMNANPLSVASGKPSGGITANGLLSLAGGASEAVSGLTQGDSPLESGLSSFAGISSTFSSLSSMTTGGLSATLGSAGPIAAAAGAIYSIFAAGAPSRNPTNEPDLNQPGYGQFVANIQGAPVTTGNVVTDAQSQYSTAAGNQNLGVQLEQYLQAGNTTGLTTDQLAAYNQLKALGGGVSNGLNIDNEHNDVFTLGSGQQVNVEQYESLVDSVQTMMGSFNQAALTAAQNVNALASSFTAQVLGGPAGFTMPTGINGSSGLMSSTAARDGTGGTTVAPSVTVNVLQGATVNSADDVTSAITQAIPQITAAVNATNYNQYRLVNNYTSVTS
jgi:hypothetical protein